MTAPHLHDASPAGGGSSRLLAVGVLLIVLAAGVIGGVVLERTVLRPKRLAARAAERERHPRRPSDMLGADLKLGEDQRVRIDTIIERQMAGYRDIRKSTQPAIDSLAAQTRRAIDSVLSPEQRVQLDSARARREAAFRRRFPNGTPRGPGGWGRGSRLDP